MLNQIDIQAMREEFKQSLRQQGAKSRKVTSNETFTDVTTILPLLYDSVTLHTCTKKDDDGKPVGDTWQTVFVRIGDEDFFFSPRSRKGVKYPDGPLPALTLATANGTFEGKPYSKPVALLD